MKLCSSYGLAEILICVLNPTLGALDQKVSNLGKGLSSAFWVVEPNNTRYIVSVGNIGELLIQDPMIARGYLPGTESKAAARRLRDVDWLPGMDRSTRVYRSSDLFR